MTSFADPDAERAVTDALDAALSACAASSRDLSGEHGTLSGEHDLPDARVAIAYSGGLDSSVLLDAAVRVAGARRCVALHVHHGLSPHADSWLAHCESVARAYGVAFDAQRVSVPPRPDAGIEAAARAARYRALDALCATHRAQSLWLAQHADDQAETVLLQLLRGAGLAGLAAMAPVRAGVRQSQGQGRYRQDQNQNQTQGQNQAQSQTQAQNQTGSVPRVRPLLALSRVQLERYARARALRWIDDESNADLRYARNALRHTVVPALAAHFPGFRHALARTATHAASAQQLLDDLARIDLHRACANVSAGADTGIDAGIDAGANAGRALRLDALLALDDARALNLLRYWMRTLDLPAASNARISDALRQLRDVGSRHRNAHDTDDTHEDDTRDTDKPGDICDASGRYGTRDADNARNAGNSAGSDAGNNAGKSGGTRNASHRHSTRDANETHHADGAGDISAASSKYGADDLCDTNKPVDADKPGDMHDTSHRHGAHDLDETRNAARPGGTRNTSHRHSAHDANETRHADGTGDISAASSKYGANSLCDTDKPGDTDKLVDTDKLGDMHDMSHRHGVHDLETRNAARPGGTRNASHRYSTRDANETRHADGAGNISAASSKYGANSLCDTNKPGDTDKLVDADKPGDMHDMSHRHGAHDLDETRNAARPGGTRNASHRHSTRDANETHHADGAGNISAASSKYGADDLRDTDKLGDMHDTSHRHGVHDLETRNAARPGGTLNASHRHGTRDANEAHHADGTGNISVAGSKYDDDAHDTDNARDTDKPGDMHDASGRRDTVKANDISTAGGKYATPDTDVTHDTDKPGDANNASNTHNAGDFHDNGDGVHRPLAQPARMRASRATHATPARATRKIHATGASTGTSTSASDHLLRIDHAGQRLRCYRGLVFWEAATMTATSKMRPHDAVQQIWRGEEVWRLPQWRGTFVFAPVDAHGANDADDKDVLPETLLRCAPLIARARSGSERMRCTPGSPARTLKNLFQERGVPAWARDVPLLFSGDTLLFVPSIGVNRAALAQIAKPSARTRWRRIEWREDLLIA